MIALIASAARADTSFTSKIQVYADSDHTTVVSPVVDVSADVTPNTTVTAGYLADAVTSASIDVVSQASQTTIHDLRHQVSVGASHVFGSLTARAGYTFSTENDYLSHSISAGIAQDLDDKNTTLSLGYALSLNTVGRSHDETFSRSLDVHSLSASWTQVFSTRTIGQLTYELGYADGYQASPYRFVPVRMTVDSAPLYWIAETDPLTRWRHAVVVGVNHAVGADAAVGLDYRLYHDTWGITSHTVDARYSVNLSKRLELRLRERLYTQGAASFYQANYSAPQKYMAFDRELSPLQSTTTGAKLSYLFTPHLEGELKLDLFYYRYSDFPPLSHRVGANTGIGLSITY
ncbi:MAG TPA: DUF3570 domain-containing protein [Kofleriaceae bacterium]